MAVAAVIVRWGKHCWVCGEYVGAVEATVVMRLKWLVVVVVVVFVVKRLKSLVTVVAFVVKRSGVGCCGDFWEVL